MTPRWRPTAAAAGLFLHEYYTDLAAGTAPELARAESQTIAVTTIILFQCAYLLNCRSLTESAFRIGLFSNRYVYFGIAATLGLRLCFVYAPTLNALCHTHPLDAADWIAPTLVALVGLPMLSLEKRLWCRRGKSGRDGAAAGIDASRLAWEKPGLTRSGSDVANPLRRQRTPCRFLAVGHPCSLT